MNDESESVEAVAKRLAARGHDALVARLRDAFAQAAAKHADLVSVDEDQLEQLVQRSAERADGLQWRRALADAACEELGIELVQALQHPAVARAQELVGAPSYEDSLAELADRTGARRRERLATTADAEDEPERDADPDEPDEDGDAFEANGARELGGDDAKRLRIGAIHLGGVESLPTAADLELVVSGNGLDIVQGDDEVLGRLNWSEIDALDVPALRGRQRRRAQGARLIVRTRHGDASFEVPAFNSDELRERINPLFARFGRRRRLSG